MVTDKTAIHMPDATATPGYRDGSDKGAISGFKLAGARTVLAIPMLKENELIGSFTLYRKEVVRLPTSRSSWSTTSPPRR